MEQSGKVGKLAVLLAAGAAAISWCIYKWTSKKKHRIRPTPPNNSRVKTNSFSSPEPERADIILLYADDDHNLAIEILEALMSNVGVSNLSVDLYENVGLGESTLQHLFDYGNYVFVLLSNNYNRNRLASFRGQINLVHSMLDEEARSRIIPVVTECGVAIPEFFVLQGVNYHRYKNDKSDTQIFNPIKNLVEKGRRRNALNERSLCD